jgi:hypothetical protein
MAVLARMYNSMGQYRMVRVRVCNITGLYNPEQKVPAAAYCLTHNPLHQQDAVSVGVHHMYVMVYSTCALCCVNVQALVLAASLFATRPPSSSSASSSSSSAADTEANPEADPGSEGFRSQDLDSTGFGPSSSSSSSVGAAKGTVELVSPGGGRSDLDQPLVLGSTGILSAGPVSSSSMGFGGSSSGIGSGGSIINVQHASARTADDASASVFKQLMPQSEWEWRAMLAVAVVRFVLLPAATCALVLGASNAGLLPPDPACVFMLLLQSCMPPGMFVFIPNFIPALL